MERLCGLFLYWCRLLTCRSLLVRTAACVEVPDSDIAQGVVKNDVVSTDTPFYLYYQLRLPRNPITAKTNFQHYIEIPSGKQLQNKKIFKSRYPIIYKYSGKNDNGIFIFLKNWYENTVIMLWLINDYTCLHKNERFLGKCLQILTFKHQLERQWYKI